ncbi:MAG: replication protein RepA [Rhodopila sp.]
MGMVHDLIEQQGKQAALLAEADRRAVEAAASYMADEDNGIGFLYSGWCQAALPHRRLPNSQGWQITSDYVTLVVEPGMKPGPIAPEAVGVPYGSRARLIMLYLQSEALRTGSRQVQLGRSMRDWLHRMGIPPGGKSIDAIRDQAERISRCRLSLNIRTGRDRSDLTNQNIVDRAIFLDPGDSAQGSLFLDTAQLSETFFAELQRHPVPLEDAAVRAISNNSLALDLYAWLAYRLHALKQPTPVSWSALKGQFGTGFNTTKHFRPAFIDNLRLALAVYRDAKVEMTERGVDLHPSKPPVAPRQVAVGKVLTSHARQSIKSSCSMGVGR